MNPMNESTIGDKMRSKKMKTQRGNGDAQGLIMKQEDAKLPESEWKFESLKGIQEASSIDSIETPSDLELLRGVFLYEFARQSEKLRELVLDCRKMVPPAMIGASELEGYISLSSKARQLVFEKSKGRKSFERLVEALVNCPKFPNTPALELEDMNWLGQIESAPALRFCTRIIDTNQGIDAGLQQMTASPGIEYRFDGSYQAEEFESVVPIVIDWRNTDEQIKKEFQAKVLSAFRRERFISMAKGTPQQTPIAELCSKLPFKLLSALRWLGVLRCYENAGSWRRFFKIGYAIEEIGGYIRTDERAAQADKRKALLILDWLENGTALAPSGFK